MTTSTVTVRVDTATKEAAAAIVEDFGFDLSSVTRAFYRQIVREQRIPLTLEYPRPNQESLESIREAEAMLSSDSEGYESAEAMFEALGV